MAAGSVEIGVTPELASYYTAQEIRITLTVRDIDGVVADPSNLTLRIRRPDDTEVEYTYGLAQLTRVSAGVYYYDLLIDLSYRWRFRGEASGVVDASGQLEFAVEGSVFAVTAPPASPGSGHEGEVAIVQGGVYQPYAGSAGMVLGWVDGIGWTAVAAGGGGGTPGGSDTELQYNNSGAFGGTAGIKIGGTESQLRFYGASGTEIPATDSTSLLAVFHGVNVFTARNAANSLNGALMSYGIAGTDILSFGDTGGVASMVFAGKSGAFFDFNVAGTVRARIGAAAGNFSLDNFSYGSVSVASGAWHRFPNNTTILACRNYNGTTDDSLVSVAVAGSTTELTIGQTTGDLNVIYLKSSGQVAITANSNEYVFGAGLTMQGNYLAFGVFASTPYASTGLIRFAHNVDVLVGRNNADSSNGQLVRWGFDGNDILTFGTNTVVVATYYRSNTEHRWYVSGTQRLSLTGTELTLNGINIVSAAKLNGAWVLAPTQGTDLTDANQTLNISTAANYYMAAGTTSAARDKTLGVTGAADRSCMTLAIYVQGHNVVIKDDAATVLLTVTAGTAIVADFVYNGTSGHYQLGAWKTLG